MSAGPEFLFLGQRAYLHATTLYNYIQDAFVAGRHAPRRLDFIFMRRTDRVCRAVDMSGAQTPEGAVALYSDQALRLAVLETGEPVKARRDYDESRILGFSRFQGQSILVAEDPRREMGFIERVVAGFKTLLHQADPGPGSGYSFVRLRLESVPDGPFSIEHVRSLPGGFQEGAILVDGSRIGAIYFKAEAQ